MKRELSEIFDFIQCEVIFARSSHRGGMRRNKKSAKGRLFFLWMVGYRAGRAD